MHIEHKGIIGTANLTLNHGVLIRWRHCTGEDQQAAAGEQEDEGCGGRHCALQHGCKCEDRFVDGQSWFWTQLMLAIQFTCSLI